MSQESLLLFANEAFYVTFTNRDANAMDAIWSSRDNVTCIHPGWHLLKGRNHVMRSWRDILSNTKAPEIRCEHAHAFIDGDMAYVLCTEILPGGQLTATNIFVLEDEAWKMVHHQAWPAPVNFSRSESKPPTVQ